MKQKVTVLQELLQQNLDFKGENSQYVSHNMHAFAAKFPPQIPSFFIRHLTKPGDTVLDPMMGSGTAVLEAFLLGRKGIGYDFDWLSYKLCKAKTTKIAEIKSIEKLLLQIVLEANALRNTTKVDDFLREHFQEEDKKFIDYWFLGKTQRELAALLIALDKCIDRHITDEDREAVRDFLKICFSSIIITKSGGVSMARDLAHSRPHLVKDKIPKDAVEQFKIRTIKNIENLYTINDSITGSVSINLGDARNLKSQQENDSADLIVTSPPYANAIDYVRAHKFSLVWLGKSIKELRERRALYIGAENAGGLNGKPPLPGSVDAVISQIKTLAPNKAKILYKYYIEMRDVLQEMYRILKPGSPAIIVIGSSTIKGIDIKTHQCLADIAVNLDKPFKLVNVCKRNIDRDKRMMPARFGRKTDSLIEQRMHEEFVIGLIKE